MTLIAIFTLIAPTVIDNFFSTVGTSKVKHWPFFWVILHKDPGKISINIAIKGLAFLHILVTLTKLL